MSIMIVYIVDKITTVISYSPHWLLLHISRLLSFIWPNCAHRITISFTFTFSSFFSILSLYCRRCRNRFWFFFSVLISNHYSHYYDNKATVFETAVAAAAVVVAALWVDLNFDLWMSSMVNDREQETIFEVHFQMNWHQVNWYRIDVSSNNGKSQEKRTIKMFFFSLQSARHKCAILKFLCCNKTLEYERIREKRTQKW